MTESLRKWKYQLTGLSSHQSIKVKMRRIVEERREKWLDVGIENGQEKRKNDKSLIDK